MIAHGGIVLFIVAGLPAIWIGAASGWRWVRNVRFRVAHLAAIVFVAAEALLGIACPLTVWEDALRGASNGTGFIERGLHRAMFYSFPPWIFTAAYLLFALVVAATFWQVPPRRRGE